MKQVIATVPTRNMDASLNVAALHAVAGTDSLLTLEAIQSGLRDDAAGSTGAFHQLSLRSHFQPIFSLAHRRTVGFEALLRASTRDGRPLPPGHAFALAANEAETIFLDRSCRALHLRNFTRSAPDSTWLFLNVNPQVIVEGKRYGPFFRELLDLYKFPAHRVVVEILESALRDEQSLDEAIRYYRDLGCLIAIDDFGAGHSNFDRVWRLQPDIVKFDRSIVVRAAGDRSIRSVVSGMVSLVHEAGSLVLMEGIENELEAMIAMDADADFVQGYYFARPTASIETGTTFSPALGELFDTFSDAAAREGKKDHAEVAPYINGLGYASVLLRAGQPLEVACKGFLELPLAERCFLLDHSGYQIGANIMSLRGGSAPSPRYTPLNDARGANWSRRQYFRRALAQTEKVHVTRPYLSASTATQCMTVSIATTTDNELRVLCGDIVWNGKS